MLTGRPLKNFDNATFDFVLRHEGYVPRPYLDTKAIPTIGVGYALLIRSGDGFILRPTLERDFDGIHEFSAAEQDLLEDLARALTLGEEAGARALFENRAPGALCFALSDDAHRDGRRLYDVVSRELVAAAVPEDIREALAGTHELAALTSLAYNAPALVGNNLKTAIRTGDRAAAWFEIFYRSNRARGGVRPLGVHNRRKAEAEMFGLYAQGDAPSATDGGREAQAVIAFLKEREQEMRAYLASVKRTDGTGKAIADAFTGQEQAELIASHTAPARATLRVV